MDSDAQILWNDVLDLLEGEDIPASTLAMIKSCEAAGLDEGVLVIRTNLGFAQRKIVEQTPIIERCLATAAFQPMRLEVDLTKSKGETVTPTTSVTQEELAQLTRQTSDARSESYPNQVDMTKPVEADPLTLPGVDIPEADSKLTFDRFVAGEENMMAFDAAKQVANGENKNYNMLFIYGKSGLGKTHLLRAIQNYIHHNDPKRTCIYRTAADFIQDYARAMNDKAISVRAALRQSYQSVDVLIIDDIQNMRTAAGSIRFFFDTFNFLMAHGKQIVLAADRSPSQLGMGESKFDERDTSRMDSGVTVRIQVPDYELKLNLITAFYERMKQDAKEQHIPGLDATIDENLLKIMAERSGTNIRVIEGYVQSCLMLAHQREVSGKQLTRDDVVHIAQQKWPTGQHIITVDQIQKSVEAFYDIAHEDLIGSKRNKELMEPRHVAIWLTRSLTDNTLADIGKKFGGRSHATVKHSIAWVDELSKKDRIFVDRVESLQDSITDST